MSNYLDGQDVDLTVDRLTTWTKEGRIYWELKLEEKNAPRGYYHEDFSVVPREENLLIFYYGVQLVTDPEKINKLFKTITEQEDEAKTEIVRTKLYEWLHFCKKPL